MWLWQLRLQLKLPGKPIGFLQVLFISSVVHVLIFIFPFLFIKNSGVIIIDSQGSYSLPVFYKFSGDRSSQGSLKMGLARSRSGRKISRVNLKNINRKTDTGAFLKLKSFSKKFSLSKKVNKKLKTQKLEKQLNNKKNKIQKKLELKKLNNKSQYNLKKLEQEKLVEIEKVQELEKNKLDTKLENLENLSVQESNLPIGENLVDNGLSGQPIDLGISAGFEIEGYLHTDGQLVGDIRSAVSKNWSRPRGFTQDVYCEFKILVSSDGKSIKILEQKNSKVPAFNIQARGAILSTEFPEKCWGKELNLILR